MPGIGRGMFFPGFGMLMQLVIIVAVVLIVYWIIKGGKNESALEILNKRYAKGEISKKEFDKIRKDIK